MLLASRRSEQTPIDPWQRKQEQQRDIVGMQKQGLPRRGEILKGQGCGRLELGLFFIIFSPSLLISASPQSATAPGTVQQEHPDCWSFPNPPRAQNPLAQQQCQALGELFSPPLDDNQLGFAPSTLARDGS